MGQAVGIGSAGVLEPEDVEVELVALSQIRVGELAEAFEFGAFVTAMLLPIGADEIVEVAALERRDRDLYTRITPTSRMLAEGNMNKRRERRLRLQNRPKA